MPQDNRKELVTLLLVTLIFAGGYMGYYYWVSDDADPAPAAQGGTPDEGEASRDASGEGAAEEAPQQTSGDPESLDDAPRYTAEQQAAEELFTIEGEDYRAEVSNLNGGVVSFEVLAEKYAEEDGTPKQVVTTDQVRYYPLQLELGGVHIPQDAIWDVERLSEKALRLRWQGNGFEVVRKLEAGEGPYQLWSTVRVTNTASRERPVRVKMTTYHYVTREEEEGGFFASRSPGLSHGICMFGEEEVERFTREDSEATEYGDPAHGFGPAVRLTGVENTYFANVMAPHEGTAERCQITSVNKYAQAGADPHGSLFEARLIYPRVSLGAGETTSTKTLAYLGPKDSKALATAGHSMRVVVDRGWFSTVAEWLVALLAFIHGFVGNWGLAIILMTVLVRIALFPLTWKSFQSMAKMRVLKPKMDRINEQYADDREKKGAAMMELYRKEKINPLGGCLPQLLQMPVWFAFYASLSTNTELYHADFLIWGDLSSPDPYYLLPLSLGGLIFLQQKITPSPMDPAQAKVMLYFMPIMITAFMLFLPAGLCLYMVTNSVLGIGQQQWIHRSLDKSQKDKDETTDEDSEARSDGGPEGGDGDSQDEPEDIERSASVVRVTKPKSKSKTKKRRSRRAR